MKYCFLFLSLFMLGCDDEPTKALDQSTILGNWRVVREFDKATQTTMSWGSGIVTTWNGRAYISAVQIMEEGYVKINNFDNSYTDSDGTWTLIPITNHIVFNIFSFSKRFEIRRENEFLILESSTHIIWHREIK